MLRSSPIRRHGRTLFSAESLAIFLLTATATGPAALVAALAYQTFVEPLPFPRASQLVSLAETSASGEAAVSPLTCQRWANESRTLAAVGCYYAGGGEVLSRGGAHLWVRMAWMTPGVLAALGVGPEEGRAFGEHDAGGEVLISANLRRQLFADGAHAEGQVVQFGGRPVTVLGTLRRIDSVLPGVDVILPWRFDRPIGRRQRGTRYFSAVGRLKPSATLDEARADIRRVQSVLGSEFPDTHAGWKATVVPLKEALTRQHRATILVATAFAGLLTLAAALNLGLVQLTALASRRLENAVRIALGATSGMLLLEAVASRLGATLVGALVGGSAGLALMQPVLQAMQLGGASAPRTAVVAAFSVVLAVVSLAVPALVATRASRLEDPAGALRGGVAGGSRLQSLRWIAAVEVAASVVLAVVLFGLQHDLRGLSAAESRVNLDRLVLADIRWPMFSYDRIRTASALREGLGSLGLVDLGSASLDESSPLVFFKTAGDERRLAARLISVTPGYFATTGIRLRQGRTFAEEEDDSQRAPVAVVSASLARMTRETTDVMGRRIQLEVPPIEAEVVGVAEDVIDPTDPGPPLPIIYLPLSQSPPAGVTAFIRGRAGRLVSAAAVQDDVRRIGGDLVVTRVVRGEDIASRRLTRPRALVHMAALAGVICVLLSVIGCAAVTVLLLRRHERSMGIRMALGATRSDTLLWAARRQLGWIGVGLGAGAVLGAVSAPLLRTLPWPHVFDWRVSVVLALAVIAVPTAMVVAGVLVCRPSRPLAALLRADN